MVVEEYALIQVSKSNKTKLDNLKILKRESYNSVLDELIRFGEENDFRNKRIKNLTKELEVNKLAKTKINKGAIRTVTIR